MDKKKKILHICNWYPNRFDLIEAHFIKDQIDALHQYVASDVMLIQVREGSYSMTSYQISERESVWILQFPTRYWIVKEITSALLLLLFLIKLPSKKYELINFHIAYPLLTYYHWFASIVKVPVVLSEHWSAYRFNFGVGKPLTRIKRIFHTQPNLITVSQSLAQDIRNFSPQKGVRFFILPNAVNTQIFNREECVRSNDFFMLGCWQYPKQPWVILDALEIMKENGHNFKLRIGGYGPYEEKLLEKIDQLKLESEVTYIGKQSFEQAAIEMKKTKFFIHASSYETFSLVCAEALTCGTPVVASGVGGIPEFVHDKNGILVAENSASDWADSLVKALQSNFNYSDIAREAQEKFSWNSVGKQYESIINQVLKTR